MYDPELNKLLSELRKLDLKSSESKQAEAMPELSTILNLDAKTVKNKDKDLTLSEYLNKYSEVEKTIESEKKTRESNNRSYEELLRQLEGDSEEYIDKKIEEDFDYREVKTIFSKQENGKEEVKTKDIFTNKSKERCNNVTLRIKPYANTKSVLTQERKMGPLKLEQFNS